MRHRHALLACASALAVTVAPVPAASAAAPAQPAATAAGAHGPTSSVRVAADRAQASFAALEKYFGAHDGSGLYREQYPSAPGDRTYSYEWPFSQVHVAALDLTGMAGAGRRYLPALRATDVAQQHYWVGTSTTGLPGFASGAVPPYGTGGDLFYDDNEWVGLQDVQHHALYGDAASLTEARRISALVESGWDDDPAHAAPGGVFWTQAPWSTDRNTVSNLPGAELDLRLYQLTHERHYLDEALKYYQWTNRYLQRPDGLYDDHLDLHGNVETTVWSYNQGVAVGVDTLLFQVTGDDAYLAEAERVAAAAYRYFVTEGRLDAQPPYFNSIFLKNLLLLESVTGGHTYRDAMAAYGDRMWTQHRDAKTGLFHFGGSSATQVIEQAAMTQVYAVLAWPHGRYRDLY